MRGDPVWKIAESGRRLVFACDGAVVAGVEVILGPDGKSAGRFFHTPPTANDTQVHSLTSGDRQAPGNITVLAKGAGWSIRADADHVFFCNGDTICSMIQIQRQGARAPRTGRLVVQQPAGSRSVDGFPGGGPPCSGQEAPLLLRVSPRWEIRKTRAGSLAFCYKGRAVAGVQVGRPDGKRGGKLFTATLRGGPLVVSVPPGQPRPPRKKDWPTYLAEYSTLIGHLRKLHGAINNKRIAGEHSMVLLKPTLGEPAGGAGEIVPILGLLRTLPITEVAEEDKRIMDRGEDQKDASAPRDDEIEQLAKRIDAYNGACANLERRAKAKLDKAVVSSSALPALRKGVPAMQNPPKYLQMMIDVSLRGTKVANLKPLSRRIFGDDGQR